MKFYYVPITIGVLLFYVTQLLQLCKDGVVPLRVQKVMQNGFDLIKCGMAFEVCYENKVCHLVSAVNAELS